MDAKADADCFVGIDVAKARGDVRVRPEGTPFYCATDLEPLIAAADPLAHTFILNLQDSRSPRFRSS